MIFSNNYVEARESFLIAAESAGFRCNRFRVSTEETSELFIDFALLRRDPKKLLLHVCGTHGVEGYAGSAVQRSILAESFTETGPSILMVHPLNPFGMAFYRRNNAENVDLNRNFIKNRNEINNSEYKLFHRYLNPKGNYDYYFAPFMALFHSLRIGKHRTLNAVASGQREFPGLFYIGDKVQREIFLLQDFLKNHFKDIEMIFGIDVHTGLGAFAQESLIVDESKEPNENFFQETFARNLDREDPKKGIYKNNGPLSDAIRALYPSKRIHFVVQEFGTHPTRFNLKALRKQNMLWRTKKEEDAIPDMLEAFCPQNDLWRSTVVELGKKRFFQALEALQKC